MTHPTPAETPVRTTGVMPPLMLLMVAAALDQTMLSTALPSIARDLGQPQWLPWVYAAYLIASTVAVPLYGRLADLWGPRKPLLIASAVFLVGALASASVTSLPWLVAARALQGLGGGGLMTLSMLVAAQMGRDLGERARLQGLVGAAFGLSTLAGPLLGSLVVQWLPWRGVFLLLWPLAAATTGLLARRLPRESRHSGASFDSWGLLLLSVALVSLLLATRRDPAWSAEFIGSLLGLAGLAAASFVHRARRVAHPLLPLPLLSHAWGGRATLLSLCAGAVMFGSVVYLPLMLQLRQHLSPTASALQLMPLMLGLVTAAIGCGRLLRAGWAPRRLAALSAALIFKSALGLAAVLQASTWHGTAFSLLLAPLGLGIGLLLPLTTVLSQRSAPAHWQGSATALPVMSRTLGGAIWVSLMGGWFGLDARHVDTLGWGCAQLMLAQAALGLAVAALAWGLPRSLGAPEPAAAEPAPAPQTALHTG